MACRELDLQKGPLLFCETVSTKTGDWRWIHRPWRQLPSLLQEPMMGGGKHANSCAIECRSSSTAPIVIHQGSSLLNLVKECGKQKDLTRASSLHAHMLAKGLFTKNISLGNALITTYADCGALAKAQELFDQLPARNVVTWNTLMAAYTRHGFGDVALSCFKRMQDQGLSPNAITFICILKACGATGAMKTGEEIHAEAGRQGLLEKDIVLGTTLVDMYVKCDALSKAQAVFDKLPSRNEVTWNVLIGGYAEHGLNDEALSCFRSMKDEGLVPNAATFKSILKVYSNLKAADKGDEVHEEISRQGLLGKDSALDTALVDMYAKCGALSKARGVFDKLPIRSLSTWTALIHGYAEHGFGKEALSFFCQMRDKGICPDVVTYVCILRACSSIGVVHKGEVIHMDLSSQGLLKEDSVVVTALVDMYCECGAVAKARGVISKLPARTVATWNALISGYVQHGFADEALCCFRKMNEEGVSPSPITYTCILKACGTVGAATRGQDLHLEVIRKHLLKEDTLLGTALLDMYMNCGLHTRAAEVFEVLDSRSTGLWTVLMGGYAQLGRLETVFDIFDKMVAEGVEPNLITFTVLLTACSHAGRIEEGQMCFEIMSTSYGLFPSQEHWTCIVDILSRAGLIEKAICMIEMVPPADCLLLWSALMGACQQCVNVKLGRWAFEQAVLLDKESNTAYICMRNLYAAAGMHQEAAALEDLRLRNVCGQADMHVSLKGGIRVGP